MTLRLMVVSLRVFLVIALFACLLTQGLVLPVVSGEVAHALPEVSYMRWPVLVWAIVMILLGEIALVCTWHLLTAVSRGHIFTQASLPWVDGITGCFVAAGLALLVGLAYLAVDGTVGPVTVHASVLLAAIGCLSLAALMVVMRTLLVQATQLRTDMDEVI